MQVSKNVKRFSEFSPEVLNEVRAIKQRVTPYFDVVYKQHWKDGSLLIAEVLRRLGNFVDRIIDLAEEKGIDELEAYFSSCNRPTCDTCLCGKVKAHYPYFRGTANKEYFADVLEKPIKTNSRGNISIKQLKDFLRCLGLSEDEIEHFFDLCKLYSKLVNTFHKYTLRLNSLGLSDIGERELILMWGVESER
ncbi:MAG: hypothetical protein QW090_04100 [Candidatus Bathyarchaeia archaeon]